MHITKVKLHNFRNYDNQEIDFYKNVNVFYGDNAQGKTNILESVFLCSYGKSFRTRKEKESIKFKKDKAVVELEFEKESRKKTIKIEIADKKYIQINGVKCLKSSHLLGNINLVMFCPDDLEILKQGPALRRKFLDIMISSLKPNYLFVLNQYLKNLEQRNIFLKQLKKDYKNIDMLDIWDYKLGQLSERLYQYRKEFVEKLNLKIFSIHQELTNGEKIKIEYFSDCQNKEKYIENLKNTRKIDIIKGYTGKGIHRDDLIFYINDNQVNVYGSQGQCRSCILSLKFAELEVVYEELGEYPILLLDDVMSELDEKRKTKLIQIIKNYQVLITSAEKEKFDNWNTSIKYFFVNNGTVKDN